MSGPASGPQDAIGFDPRWEEMYEAGRALNRYPWDVVVNFVHGYAPRERPRQTVTIAEVGCGTASNLWFAAREGFTVAGIDGSAAAIEYARERFVAEELKGDLRIGDFAELPWPAEHFDLVIDRAALTHTSRSTASAAIAEVRRVLRPGGRFLFTPHGAGHDGVAFGVRGPDGLTLDISEGPLAGMPQTYLYDLAGIHAVLDGGWHLLSVQRVETVEKLPSNCGRRVGWQVIAERTA
jgi:SAM-dependent methyltransferase